MSIDVNVVGIDADTQLESLGRCLKVAGLQTHREERDHLIRTCSDYLRKLRSHRNRGDRKNVICKGHSFSSDYVSRLRKHFARVYSDANEPLLRNVSHMRRVAAPAPF